MISFFLGTIDRSRPRIFTRRFPREDGWLVSRARARDHRGAAVRRASSCVGRTLGSTTRRTSGRIERRDDAGEVRARIGPRAVRVASNHSNRLKRWSVWRDIKIARSLSRTFALGGRSRVCARYRVLVNTTTTTTSSSSSSLLSSLVGKREGSVFWDSVLELSPRRRRGRASHGERRRQRWKRRWEKRRDGRKREHG